jgi:nucleoid DNA-binding protein
LSEIDPGVGLLTKKEESTSNKGMRMVIAENIGMSQTQTQQILHEVFSRIIQRLVEQGHSGLPHFGVFEVKRSMPLPARNPRTGERVLVPGRAVVTFKPSQEMEEQVQWSCGNYCGVAGHCYWLLTKKEELTSNKGMRKVIAENIGMSQTQTQQILHRAFSRIIQRLVEQGHSELPPFGVFEVKRSKPLPARNPRTGERVLVPGRAVVTFKPSREMEERVQWSCGNYQAVPRDC